MKCFFFLLLFRLILAQNETQLSSDEEKQLQDDIFKNYNKHVLPPHNSTQPVLITAQIAAIHLRSLDFAEQTLNIECWLRLKWNDNRLAWDQQKYNINVLRLNVNTLWKPDVTILNSADANLIELPERSSTRHALVYPSGETLWIPTTSLNVLCALDMTYYPYDTHNCSIQVGSWRSDVDFQLRDDKKIVDVMDLFNYTEWEVLDTYAQRSTDKYNVLSDDNIYMSFSLKIGRARPLYCAISLFPIAAGIILSITAFLVSPFDNKRIGFNVFVLFLFAFTLFHLISLFPSVGQRTPVVVSICESLIILIALSIVWNLILLTMFGHLKRTKLTPFLQKFLSSWPIQFINQLFKDDARHVDSMRANGEMATIILNQSESTNEWQHLLVVLDRLALIVFIVIVLISLLAFCC